MVTGNSPKALCVLGRLEQLGICPSEMVWIRTRDSAITNFDHDEINKLIEFGLMGEDVEGGDGQPHVTVYDAVDILDVNFGVPLGAESGEEQIIESLKLCMHPPKNSVIGAKEEILLCSILLCCSNEQCNVDVFAAINDTGLVYDGNVIVDAYFRTVDPYIYAVGPMTKYSRRYRNQIQHHRYSMRELGAYVQRISSPSSDCDSDRSGQSP